jgi:hypothetical protein
MVQEPPQVVGERPGVPVTPGRVLGQRLVADGLQVGRDPRGQPPHRDRLLLQQLIELVDLAVGQERRPTGEHLVEHLSHQGRGGKTPAQVIAGVQGYLGYLV